MPSPPKRAHKAAGTRREPVDKLANLGEPSAQLGVADLDRHQRVLERHELAIRVPDRVDGVLDEALYASRRHSRRRRRQGAGRQSMTAGEPCVGALGTAVGALNGPEQLLLQAIGLLVVQLLVRCAQRRECASEVIDRLTALDVPQNDILIVLHEPPMHNWGVNGGVPASEVDVGFNVDI